MNSTPRRPLDKQLLDCKDKLAQRCLYRRREELALQRQLEAQPW